MVTLFEIFINIAWDRKHYLKPTSLPCTVFSPPKNKQANSLASPSDPELFWLMSCQGGNYTASTTGKQPIEKGPVSCFIQLNHLIHVQAETVPQVM